MTDDSYELVSAYLDGQATDEEVARIEADPSLLQEVAAMRAISEELVQNPPAPDPVVRDSQIAAALDLFDILAAAPAENDHADQTDDGTGDEGAAAIVDITQARQGRARAEARQAKARPNGVPRWLGVAAGLLIVVGGVGWIATQGFGGADDASETASVQPTGDDAGSDGELTVAESGEELSAEADEAAEGGREVEQSLAATTSTTAQPSLSAPAADGAAESDAAAGDAAADSDELEEEAADEERAGGGGLFPGEEVEEARKSFDGPPTPEELSELADGPLFPVEFAACGADVVGPDPATLLGFFPISIGDVGGEAFVFDAELEGLTTVVVDGDCQPIE